MQIISPTGAPLQKISSARDATRRDISPMLAQEDGITPLPPRQMQLARVKVKTICYSWNTDQLRAKTSLPKHEHQADEEDIIIHLSPFLSAVFDKVATTV